MDEYRLADLRTGPFGETFISLDDAYAALEKSINAALTEDIDPDYFCIVDQIGSAYL